MGVESVDTVPDLLSNRQSGMVLADGMAAAVVVEVD
jgi:hypothetical protein